MSPRTLLLLFVVVILLIITFACSSTSQQQAATQPVSATSLASGAGMYGSYCADCHGADGKGNGPITPTLRVSPPDLTKLAKQNRGTYPAGHVFQAIKWGGGVYRPRSKVMPVWGAQLKQVSSNDDAKLSARIMDLTNYVESLQVQ
jgi:mono/diheme cytochrome c family protein